MVSLRTDLPREYRERAEEARKKAEAATDEAARKRFLQDADNWERMARFKEQEAKPPA